MAAQSIGHNALKPERGRITALEEQSGRAWSRFNGVSARIFWQGINEIERPHKTTPLTEEQWEALYRREYELGAELRRLNDEIAAIRAVDVRR